MASILTSTVHLLVAAVCGFALWRVRPLASRNDGDDFRSAALLLALATASFGLVALGLALAGAGFGNGLRPGVPGSLIAAAVLSTPAAALLLLAAARRRASAGRSKSDQALVRSEATIAELHASVDALRDVSADAVYCFRISPPIKTTLPVGEQVRRSYEAMLVDCNDAFVERFHAGSRADLVGMRLGDMRAAEDTSVHDRMIATFVRSGYRLQGYERSYLTTSGEQRPVQVWLRGVVVDGFLATVWGREHDDRDIRELTRKIRAETGSQETVARVASRLLTSSNETVHDAIRASLRDVCRYSGADRATIVWFDRDTSAVQALYHWKAGEQAPAEHFSLKGFGWMTPLILGGETVSFSSAEELPATAATNRESLRQMGIKSALVAPIVVEHRSLGALSLTNLERERDWPERFQPALSVIAACCGSVIARLRAQQRLDAVMQELSAARDRLEAENVYLQQEILSTHGFTDLVGESSVFHECLLQVSQVAATVTPVLVQGETGTGKELIAHAIHRHSERRDRPLVKVNCAALPASLIESELFGHERGAFTGAVQSREGRFDLADGGTLFLDEIGDIAADLQAKLLRVLQDGEFQRVGGTRTIHTDVRIIAATNRDLHRAVERGHFRADLYYRINTFTIEVPPLRERHGDIALLAQHFVRKHAQQLGKQVESISQAMLDALERHDWPGNVRELEGVVQRSLIDASGPVLGLSRPLGAPSPQRAESGPGQPVSDLRSAETAHIRSVLDQCNWKIAGARGAAARLGLPESTLRSRMKKLGIERPTLAD